MKPFYEDEYSTLYHGNCHEILPLLPQADALISDPPYGGNWDPDTTRFSGGHDPQIRGSGRNDQSRIMGDDRPFDPLPFLAFPKVILWGFQHFAATLPRGTVLVWIKRLDPAFGSFLSDAELAWMKGGKGVYCKRDLSNNGITASRAHPTQKSVNLMKWCIEKARFPAMILDPFCGSGATLVAAKELGLKSIGVEIELKYCKIAAERLKNTTPSLFTVPPPKPEQMELLD